MKSNAAVMTAGIIKFGHRAQEVFNRLPIETQDRAFIELAPEIAATLNTSLEALVVHLDKTAIHAHFTMRAYNDGGESAQNYGLAAQAMGGMAEPAEQPTALSGLMRTCQIPAQLPADCAEITPEALAHEMKNEANIGMAENAACQITDRDTDEISALMMDLLKTSAAQREGRPVNEQGTSLAMECD
ncbi:MAG: hypothetical protein ABJM43_07245 [Paracoccaceae bacterium]